MSITLALDKKEQARRFLDVRRALNFSQADMGDKLGKHKQAIGAIERGENGFSHDLMNKLVKMNVSPLFLYCGVGPMWLSELLELVTMAESTVLIKSENDFLKSQIQDKTEIIHLLREKVVKYGRT